MREWWNAIKTGPKIVWEVWTDSGKRFQNVTRLARH